MALRIKRIFGELGRFAPLPSRPVPAKDRDAALIYLIAGDDAPHAVVAATGSELHLAVGARAELAKRGVKLNVVSIPCVELLDAQPASYRRDLFPDGVPVATIEAGCTAPWRGLTGSSGLTIGIDRYGASAPGAVNGEHFGFTVPAVTARIGVWLDDMKRRPH